VLFLADGRGGRQFDVLHFFVLEFTEQHKKREMDRKQIVEYLRLCGPTFVVNGARAFWDTLKKYRLHQESDNPLEYIDANVCSIDGCSAWCQLMVGERSFMYLVCELADTLVQMLDHNAAYTPTNPWFHFRSSVQRLEDIPAFVGNLLLRTVNDTTFELMFPCLRDNVLLMLMGNPLAPTTKSVPWLSIHILRLLANANMRVFFDGAPRPALDADELKAAKSSVLRILVDLMMSMDQAQITHKLSADFNFKLSTTFNYNLLVADIFPFCGDRPDVFTSIKYLLDRCSSLSTAQRIESRIVEARDTGMGTLGAFDHVAKLAHRLYTDEIKRAILECDADNYIILFMPAPVRVPSEKEVKWMRDTAMGPQLDVDNGAYKLVPLPHWRMQRAGAALFCAIVLESEERGCVYKELARMFESMDFDRRKWCTSICCYWLTRNQELAIDCQLCLKPENSYFCHKEMYELMTLLVKDEDLFLWMKERPEDQIRLLEVFLTMMLMFDMHVRFDSKKVAATCWSLYKHLKGADAALDISEVQWLLKLSSPVPVATMERIYGLVTEALVKKAITPQRALSILHEFRVPLCDHKVKPKKRLPSRARERHLSRGRQPVSEGDQPGDGIQRMFALFDFQAMGNVSAAYAWHHMTTQGEDYVFNGLVPDQIFYVSDTPQLRASVADNVLTAFESKGNALRSFDDEILEVTNEYNLSNLN
jgi:hypothetical protein